MTTELASSSSTTTITHGAELSHLPADVLVLLGKQLHRPCHLFKFARICRQTWYLLEDLLYAMDAEWEKMLPHNRHGYALGEPAIHWAARKGNIKAAGKAIAAAKKANPAHLDATQLQRRRLAPGMGVEVSNAASGWPFLPPPIHLAAAAGHVEIVHMLMQAGCEVDMRFDYSLGRRRPVECLMCPHKICDPNSRNCETALLLAIKNGHLDIVRLLLDASDAPVVPTLGFPLHVAAYRGHISIALELLKRGVDVNAHASIEGEMDGHTPLTAAACKAEDDNGTMIRLLLDHHADVEARNWNTGGMTAQELARDRRLANHVKTLNKWAASHSGAETDGTIFQN